MKRPLFESHLTKKDGEEKAHKIKNRFFFFLRKIKNRLFVCFLNQEWSILIYDLNVLVFLLFIDQWTTMGLGLGNCYVNLKGKKGNNPTLIAQSFV